MTLVIYLLAIRLFFFLSFRHPFLSEQKSRDDVGKRNDVEEKSKTAKSSLDRRKLVVQRSADFLKNNSKIP